MLLSFGHGMGWKAAALALRSDLLIEEVSKIQQIQQTWLGGAVHFIRAHLQGHR